jgi:hypothetical protein
MQSKTANSFLILLATIFAITFSGCGGSKPAPAKVPTPKWITSVLPSDTTTTMYGMGIEKNREMAINAALSDMIAKLGTNIESIYHTDQKVTNSYSSLEARYIIKAEVSKIKVNNYKVIKSHRINYREFAVMIQTDKKKFVDGLKADLKVKKKSIEQRYTALSSRDILTKYNGKKTIALEADKLTPMILMISQLDATFDKYANTKFVADKEKEFLAQEKSLKFYVASDEKSTAFGDKIKNYLAQNGFKVVNHSSSAVKIELKTTQNITNGNIRIAVLTLNVGVYDKSDRIGGKTIILKERYNSSLPSVYKNAAIHLEQDIKAQGINELIGINLDIN